MILNFERKQTTGLQQPVLVLIHGLFGSLSNLGMLARAFEHQFDVIQLDVRNHGRSPQSDEVDYRAMALDVVETLDDIGIQNFSVIGHSMGGKIAMSLTQVVATRLEKIVILDMAPFAYQQSSHQHIFEALIAVNHAKVATRKDATEIMRSHIQEEGVIQFLLKSFSPQGWLFNVDALYQHYDQILAWDQIPVWNKPILFLRGEQSPYISTDQHILAIDEQFSDAQIETIQHAGHWLHAEKTDEVLAFINAFFSS